jgi:sarcosine oxidase
VAHTYLDADPTPISPETCIYTTTADEHFILERRGRFVIGSACSGHGFKFAPAVGQRLARMATDIL